MTISWPTRVAGPFTGNGTASAFPFNWKVFSAADLDVVRRNITSGTDTVLVLNTDYTVTLNGNQNTNPGGTVTLTAGALASGFTLTLTSDLANLQPTDLTNQGGFYPEVINDSLDRATIQIQQLAGEVSRSIRAPLADGSPAMVLPPSDVRSNGFLAFDGNGLPTIQAAASGAAPTSITRQVFSGTGSQTVFNLSTDPGGAGNSAQVFIGGVYQQRNTYTINGTVLTFSQAPVAGTNNIEFVNFLIGSGANGVGIVTLTGDVTGSGTGTVPATIAADSVTFAKMQNIATDRLLGRDTAGTGDVEELTVSGGIEFTGTGIRTSAFTGDVTKAAGGVATTIASGAVTPAKLSTGAPSWDSSSNLTVGGDLTVTGNDIKASGGTTALTMSGADVTVAGDITVAGNDIKSSTATAMTLSGADVSFAGAPSYASDPASANVLARKSYVDSVYRIGATKIVKVDGANTGIAYETGGTTFSITSSTFRAPTGESWEGTRMDGTVEAARTVTDSSDNGPNTAANAVYVFVRLA